MTPWYKEPWPWILMSGPAAVIVASGVTAWLAVKTADGLVAEDYYKRGLAVNQVLARERAAERLGVGARVERLGDRIRVRLSGAAPPALLLRLEYATQAGRDVRLRLEPAGAGVYEAHLPPLPAGHWRLILEDPRRQWRIVEQDLHAPRGEGL